MPDLLAINPNQKSNKNTVKKDHEKKGPLADIVKLTKENTKTPKGKIAKDSKEN